MLIASAGSRKTNRYITKINAMRKARKGQAWRGFRGEQKKLLAARSRKKNGPGKRARAAESE